MKKNILCIDDIESNLFTLRSVLEDAREYNYNVFTALGAHEGFDILIKERIDLILLDVMMPEVDGYATAKMIMSNKRTREIPIIFVTAKTDDATIEACYKVGGRDYITKPLNAIELLTRISFHIRLRDKEKVLSKEKEYVQGVFDIQDNLIIVTDGHQAINVNKSVLNFFNIKSLFEFQQQHSCVVNLFEKDNGYFHLGLVDDPTSWIEEVIEKLKTDDILVKLKNQDNEAYIFALKAVEFFDMFIISLTDVSSISKQSKEFEHEANYDSLTKIYNRNMFVRLIDKKMVEARVLKSRFTFSILDIDKFKVVNDTHGHLVGDDVLKTLALLIKTAVRENDIFARWGGEEFILVLNVEVKKGTEIIENLRKLIQEHKFDVVGELTCSFGVTEFRADDTLQSITHRADEALYEAKDTGRNKVCLKV